MIAAPRLSVLATALLLAPAALAGTYYVDASLSTGANSGASWANAFQGAGGLQAALALAGAGDEVWVADGLYLPSTSGVRTLSFQLENGVAIYGGFAGGETSLAQRDPSTNVAVLSGDLAGNDAGAVYTDNSYHVLNGAGTNATAVIDGFTVTSGNANGASNNDRGGGILCLSGASPSVRRCVFLANRCSFGGGAGYINSSSPSFTDCVFDGNQGGSYGGAFDMASSVGATFERCVFRNNRAARAGAIEIFGSSPVKVFNSLFYANQSTGSGGGGAIFVSSSPAQIRNCTVVQNSATANATGGLLVSGGSPSVINCIFDGNTGANGTSGSAAQISAGVSVSYSLVPAGYTGTGNLASAPSYDACGPFPFRLAVGSAGIDAGSNAGLPAGSVLDLAGAPRFVDVPAAPDTGAGSSPLVDMGAFEADPDCNANNVPDWCDIDSGTSLDLNLNAIPDECECQGGTPPSLYCTTKINSLFCAPTMGFSGYASASNNAPFLITAVNIINQKSGLLFYGYASQATPFLGGTLCILSPTRRTPVMSSGGAPSGADCSGTFSFDFNAYIATGLDPLLQNVGQPVRAQYWSRDPQDPFTTSLTNALQFAVCQ